MAGQSNGNEMISFGAGVNSVAMTIMLVNEGWRGQMQMDLTKWMPCICGL